MNCFFRSPYSAHAELEATALSWAIFGLSLRWSKGEIDTSQEEFHDEALALLQSILEARISHN